MDKKPSYVNYTRLLPNYRWFKPIIVIALAVFFELCASVVLSIIYFIFKMKQGIDIFSAAAELTNGYDSLDVYSFEGALLSLGGVAAFIPAIWLASIIVKDRPFKTYSSISGGFDFKLFFKFVLVALVPIGIPVGVSVILGAEGGKGPVSFTVLGLIACIILTPLQCMAEEYFFRGLIMQTIGGWFKIPVIAIILQAVVFASQHPYNIYGVLEVAIAGILLAVMTYITDGLEASSAAHFVNNFTIFFLNGIGFKTIKTDTDLESLIESLVVDALFLAAVYYLTKKKNFVKRPELVISQPEPIPVMQQAPVYPQAPVTPQEDTTNNNNEV